jgi:hypothetical protein
VSELHFLQLDPRLLVVPVDDALAARLGAKVYRLAAEPFKFPEAVLVRGEDGRYGETTFRLDAANPGYVRLDNRIVTRLFGEIAPKRGDLVFAKTGELIGVLVNDSHCVILGDFTAAQTLLIGEEAAQDNTAALFRALQARWSRLPSKLQ